MKILLAILMMTGIACAEDDYTLKDWCKPFRPKVCKMAFFESEIMDTSDLLPACYKATLKMAEQHPECENYLMRFADRTINEVINAELYRRRTKIRLDELKKMLK